MLLFLGINAALPPHIQKHHLLFDAYRQKQPSAKNIKKYLGSVKGPTGEVLYHVMTHFYTVQAAVVLHGHSRILFFDKSWKQLAYCEVDVPEELPDKIKKSSLCFKYAGANNQQLEYQVLIGAALPKLLSTGSNCYTIHTK
ncbi:hypothetical protein Q5H92_22385 [Hymenobacter sp. M29]|uniref:Uncharacterized protein n=1 Tax=Hymenobacter mellowenesis TaxID=3063995 RepID=A0ABT9AGX7_9BACT|nr:hypothetical protein [Hymenobacter sp. M29]MDO7849128.1 hypothetical protein [Hymenobacter sp. M29]